MAIKAFEELFVIPTGTLARDVRGVVHAFVCRIDHGYFGCTPGPGEDQITVSMRVAFVLQVCRCSACGQPLGDPDADHCQECNGTEEENAGDPDCGKGVPIPDLNQEFVEGAGSERSGCDQATK